MTLAVLMLGISGAFARAETPLPPARPPELTPPSQPFPDPPPLPPHRPVDEPPAAQAAPQTPVTSPAQQAEARAACAPLLAGGQIEAVQLPEIDDAGACGIVAPVRVTAIRLADGRAVTLNPPATMSCGLAGQLATFVRDELSPAADAQGSPLQGLDNAAAYDCRGRNRQAGAALSEHAFGQAIDITAAKLRDGRRLAFTDPKVPSAFREKLKALICARFSTVLGPGSDGFHEDHIHVDIKERRGRFAMCQWVIR